MSQLTVSSSAPTPPPLKSRFNEMSSEEFMKIIFTELQQQDPFKPNDSSALLEQLNSIRSIESDIQMGEQLESIVFQNQLASAGNLIGKRVGGLSTENTRVAGTVKSVSRVGDESGLLRNNNWVIPMENVEYIDQQPAAGPGPNGG
ncbi:MAG: flagellar hook capping FlgD N-terminal domain-containing protein [bacterium]